MHEDERYENGLTVRKAVLGDAHVERSLAKRNDFNSEFQALITRYAWGEIWTRPGLPRHTRSLLTIGLMVALNRTDEFKLHVRAAFNNGVPQDEIRDVLFIARSTPASRLPTRRSTRRKRFSHRWHRRRSSAQVGRGPSKDVGLPDAGTRP